jgi:hypothetical protein
MVIKVIWVFGKSEYFFNHGWTGQISLIGHDNFRFRRKSNPARRAGFCDITTQTPPRPESEPPAGVGRTMPFVCLGASRLADGYARVSRGQDQWQAGAVVEFLAA